jgi:hypothetical protein
MRKLILTALILLTALIVPSTAGAAIVHAESAAGARGHVLRWALDYDAVTDDLTIDVTHTKFDGSAAIGDPQVANLVLIRPNGQERSFNLLTVVAVSDGLPGIINKGPQTYSNVATRIPPGRASLIEFRTEYTPPLGA